jgi:hypothetical protein
VKICLIVFKVFWWGTPNFASAEKSTEIDIFTALIYIRARLNFHIVGLTSKLMRMYIVKGGMKGDHTNLTPSGSSIPSTVSPASRCA